MTDFDFSRRTFAAALAALPLAGGVRPSHAGSPSPAKAAIYSFPNSPWWNHWDMFKAAMAQDPSLPFEYFLLGELGSEEQHMTALRRNRIQITGITGLAVSVLIPAFAVTMSPFLFDSDAEGDFVFDTVIEPILARWLEERGMVFLQFSEGGATGLYGKAVAIKTPGQARGMRLRGSENIATQAFLGSIGADRIALGSADQVPALQTGLIDGGTTTTVFYAMGLASVAPHFTVTAHSYDAGANVAYKQWWSTLTPPQQERLRGAYGGSALLRKNVRGWAEAKFAELKANGADIHTLTPDERSAWRDATKPARARILEQAGKDGERLLAQIEEGRQQFAKRRG
jgi:TRAP-type C4-dicarboxylate transport system substrate-binding protein